MHKKRKIKEQSNRFFLDSNLKQTVAQKKNELTPCKQISCHAKRHRDPSCVQNHEKEKHERKNYMD